MVRTISASAAKNKFGSIVDSISTAGEEVIVENRGLPVAVIIPMSAYEVLERGRKDEQRRQAVATLRRLRAEIQQQNADLTEVAANDLAREMSNDLIASIVAQPAGSTAN